MHLVYFLPDLTTQKIRDGWESMFLQILDSLHSLVSGVKIFFFGVKFLKNVFIADFCEKSLDLYRKYKNDPEKYKLESYNFYNL